MDIKILKEITKLMKENDLVEVEVEAGDLKVKLKKAVPQMLMAGTHYLPPPMAPVAAPVAAAPVVPVDEFAGCIEVISPIPGTVYLKPSPDAANFIAIGTQVDAAKVVCLIEAMKVFNEIKPDAGVKGVIKKICVNDGQPVEYGTVLFLVG